MNVTLPDWRCTFGAGHVLAQTSNGQAGSNFVSPINASILALSSLVSIFVYRALALVSLARASMCPYTVSRNCRNDMHGPVNTVKRRDTVQSRF